MYYRMQMFLVLFTTVFLYQMDVYIQLLYLMCQFMQIIIQHFFQLNSMDAHKWINLNPWSSIIYNLFASPLKEVGRSKGASYQHTKSVIVFLVETHHMLYNVYYDMIFSKMSETLQILSAIETYPMHKKQKFLENWVCQV